MSLLLKQFVERNRLPFRAKCLEIGFDGEQELVDEDALECGDVVLLVGHQHSLFRRALAVFQTQIL